MIVQIINTLDNGEKGLRVNFSTSIGNGQARWHADTPIINEVYYVEIELREEFVWGKSIRKIQDGKHLIWCDGNMVMLQGALEELSHDGLGVIRLGDSLVFIQTAGNIPRSGGFVQITTSEIELYDINL